MARWLPRGPVPQLALAARRGAFRRAPAARALLRFAAALLGSLALLRVHLHTALTFAGGWAARRTPAVALHVRGKSIPEGTLLEATVKKNTGKGYILVNCENGVEAKLQIPFVQYILNRDRLAEGTRHSICITSSSLDRTKVTARLANEEKVFEDWIAGRTPADEIEVNSNVSGKVVYARKARVFVDIGATEPASFIPTYNLRLRIREGQEFERLRVLPRALHGKIELELPEEVEEDIRSARERPRLKVGDVVEGIYAYRERGSIYMKVPDHPRCLKLKIDSRLKSKLRHGEKLSNLTILSFDPRFAHLDPTVECVVELDGREEIPRTKLEEFKVGDIVEGYISAKTGLGTQLDIGAEVEAVVPKSWRPDLTPGVKLVNLEVTEVDPPKSLLFVAPRDRDASDNGDGDGASHTDHVNN